jgi:hypothetical protein
VLEPAFVFADPDSGLNVGADPDPVGSDYKSTAGPTPDQSSTITRLK